MASSDDDDDRSPLHDAAYRSDVKRLRLILTTCAVNPNLETHLAGDGKTPLHWLCLGYESLYSREYLSGYDRENEDREEDKERSVICLELLLAAGAERVDEAKYDSLIADITRKVAEMASLKGPRASVTAARLSAAFESDSEEDYSSG